MSNSIRWTAADLERYENRTGAVCKTNSNYSKKYSGKKSTPDYPGKIYDALQALGIESVREYKFLHDRRFRFDLAIPALHIAIEFEGGIFHQGRHTRGKGYASDVKKYNLATMHNWRLLRYTTLDTSEINWEYKAALEIKNLVEGKI